MIAGRAYPAGMARMRRPDPGLLAKVPLFEGLTKRELQQIVALAKELEFDAGHEVFAEGDSGGRFYLIVDGKAAVTVGGQTRAVLGAGDYFGEISLIDDSPRSATVTAETPLRTLTLASFNFRALLDEQPVITRKLLVGVCRRFREVERSLLH